MKIANFDNQNIEITAVYFRGDRDQRRFESYPRRMVMNGQEYTFLESGMRYLVQKGQQLIRLFDVSDGQTEYRLRVDNNNHWTLVNMKAGA
ncbi:MAG: hypothetical protein AAB971_03215 [Patescibacteria group bacterium]